MKQTSKDPVKNKQKFSRKLVALGKYRYITIAKALTGAKTVSSSDVIVSTSIYNQIR